MTLSRFARIVFFTGAGLSAESGVPTYRGRGGVWSRYDWREHACQRAFERDPAKVWDFHDERRKAIAAVGPNAGHAFLADLQRSHPSVAIVTQNIDGLHQRAGARDVIELHGSLWRVRCAKDRTVEENLEAPIGSRRCRTCGGWLRPDIVWFEDELDASVVARAERAIAGSDLFVAVGTSGEVYPAADLPLLARAGGALLVEVNPEETRMSGLYDLRLRIPATRLAELATALETAAGR